MPRNDIQIKTFGGMVGSIEERDVPPNIAIFAKNLDMITEAGALVPLPADTDTGANAGGAWFAAMEDGNTIIYNSGGSAYKITGLTGSPAVALVGTLTGYSSDGLESGVSDGEAVHIGMGSNSTNKPQWIGNIYMDQFANSGDSRGIPVTQPIMEDAELVNTGGYLQLFSWASAVTTPETAMFTAGKTYFWGVSYTYDLRQESPLKVLATKPVSSSDFTSGEIGYPSTTLTIHCVQNDPPSGSTVISNRINRVNIYRGEAEGTNAANPDGGWALVKSIDVQDSGWTSYSSAPENGWEYDLVDTYEDIGDYEVRTGISPTLEHMQLHYGLSCQADSYQVVGDVWHKDLKDVPNYLFRSQEGRYDQFNWPFDYLILPQRPTALVTFLGKVYAFCESRTFVIDVQTFGVEQEIEGIGCYSRKSVVVTDFGMFWADSRNLYHHDGRSIQAIGDAVLHNRYDSDAAYENHVTTSNQWPLVVYDTKYSTAIFFYHTQVSGGYSSHGLMYHPETKRWCYVSPPENAGFGAFIHGNDGYAYFVQNGNLYRLFASGSNRTWSFVSRNLVPSLAVRARFYHAIVQHDTTSCPDILYLHNDPDYTDANGETWNNTSAPSDRVKRGRINAGTPPAWNYSENFSIAILDATGTQRVNHITITKRDLTVR